MTTPKAHWSERDQKYWVAGTMTEELELRPFSVEPTDDDIEILKGCADNLREAGDNLHHATSVVTEAVMIAARCVRDKDKRCTSYRLGTECQLAENTVSTEVSIAWQIARILLRSGIVKMEARSDD
jgi:hypothetical protein